MAGRSVNIIAGSPQPARAGRAAGIDAHPAKKRRSWGRPEPPSPGQLLMWCPPQQPVAPRERVYPAGSRGKAPPGGPGPAPPRAGPGRRGERGAGGALPLRLSGSFLGGSAADGAQTAAPVPSRPVPSPRPAARSLTHRLPGGTGHEAEGEREPHAPHSSRGAGAAAACGRAQRRKRGRGARQRPGARGRAAGALRPVPLRCCRRSAPRCPAAQRCAALGLPGCCCCRLLLLLRRPPARSLLSFLPSRPPPRVRGSGGAAPS